MYGRLWLRFVIVLTLFLICRGVAISEDLQMIVYGNIRIDGNIPPPATLIRLLKDEKIIRNAVLNIENGNYVVNVFSSDGFNPGDSIHFRVVVSSQDSFQARLHPPIVFTGTAVPYPPPIVLVDLTNNHPPTAPRLMSPAQGDTVRLVEHNPIRFQWCTSNDADGDSLFYSFRLYGHGLDTILTNIRDTVVDIDWINRLQTASTYHWYVVTNDGMVSVSSTDTSIFRTSENVTDVKEKLHIQPVLVTLYQNYPNPFNPATVISYQLPTTSHVLIKVYDMIGREVETLVEETKRTGYYTATFDGSKLASGIYIARLVAQQKEGKPFVRTMKMLLAK